MTELEEVVNRGQILPRTRQVYLRYLQFFFDYAGRDPRRWTGTTVEQWRNSLLAGGLKPRTVNTYLAAVRYASRRLAHAHGDPRMDFAGFVESAREPREPKTRQALTKKQVEKLWATTKRETPRDLRDRVLILLGLRIGLRRAGMAALDFRSFHDDDKHVTVIIKGQHKHVVALPSDLKESIDVWWNWLWERRVQGGAFLRRLSITRIATGEPKIGQRITTNGIYDTLGRRAAEAGVHPFHPHMLRHTFVSWARAAGVPDWKIKIVTGHRIPEMGFKSSEILDIYTDDLGDTPVGDLLPKL